jgi:hypothetical protein
LLSAKKAVVSLQLSVEGKRISKYIDTISKGKEFVQFTKRRKRSTPFCLVFEGRKAKVHSLSDFMQPCLVVTEDALLIAKPAIG